MDKYKKEVKEAALKHLNKRFPNSSVEHAKILAKEIINNADKNVYILSSNFHKEFYKSIEENILNFLQKKDSKFNLIVANNNNTFATELKDEFPKKFNVSYIDKNLLPKDKVSNEYINYIVNENNAFRYEYSDKDIDFGIVEAIANFNSPEESNTLINHFNQILKAKQ